MRQRREASSRRLRRDSRGFTIIETMVATLIMAVAFAGIAGVHGVSAKAQSLGQNRTSATAVANQQLELMRRTQYAAVLAGSSSTVLGGVTFTSTRTVSNVTNGKRVNVTTAWTDRFGPQSLTFSTIVSPVTNP